MEKKVTVLAGMVLGRQTIHFWDMEGPCPSRQSAPYARVAVPRVGPGGAPSRPKITKNRPRCLREGPQKVPLSKLMDKINSGTVGVAF